MTVYKQVSPTAKNCVVKWLEDILLLLYLLLYQNEQKCL